MLALVIALGGTVVFAHGGDAGQVHGCVNPADGAAGRPNVIIVGPNDTCPSGYNATDWAAQGPAGETGAQGPPPVALSPDPPSFSELAEQAGFTLKSTKTKVVKKSSSTPAGLGPKSRFARSPHCPASHPKRVTGGYETEGINPTTGFYLLLSGPQPNSLFQWSVFALAPFDQDKEWTLTAYQVCKKK